MPGTNKYTTFGQNRQFNTITTFKQDSRPFNNLEPVSSYLYSNFNYKRRKTMWEHNSSSYTPVIPFPLVLLKKKSQAMLRT